MMNPFSYRAWDTKHKILCHVISIARYYEISNETSVTYVHKERGSFLQTVESGRVVVCQFSGLNDANGKPIFEGDFVHISGTGLIKADFPFTELYIANRTNDIGVIGGNIFENPEMVEELV